MVEIKEASVVIAGNTLTFQESMTLRVAISSFLMSMKDDDSLGVDLHGRIMTKSYRKHASTIQRYIHEEAR